MKNKVFHYKDFLQMLDAGPERLADFCNRLVEKRTIPVRLDKHAHDVVRADAGFTVEYLKTFPLFARMTRPSYEE